MNREAVALGVPVYTTFGGRIGAVDEALLREGRLRQLTDPGELELASGPEETRAAFAATRASSWICSCRSSCVGS